MVSMYEIIRLLCKRDEISIAQMCRDTGLRQGLISDLKHGRTKSLSASNMQKISNYFQVSTDIFNEGVFEETLPNAADMDYLREIQLKFSLKNKKASTDNSEHVITDDDIKFALFGDVSEITDADLDDVRRYAEFVKERRRKQNGST